jgi:hypothetical protein
MPAAGRSPPPFIGKGEAASDVLHDVLHSIVVPTYNAYGVTVVPANLGFRRRRGSSCTRLGTASRVVRVWSSSIHWFEGLAKGRALVAQGTAWRCPVRRGLHSAEDHRTGPEVTEGTRSANPVSRHRPDQAPGQQSYALRGCPHALSRGTTWGKDGTRCHSALE